MRNSCTTRFRWPLVCLLALGVLMGGCSAARQAPSLPTQLARATEAVSKSEQSLISFRHDLHRHPELSGQERRTSAKIAEQLELLGFEVRTHVGGYGVVGVLRGGGSNADAGPTIAFRADMDASRDSAPDPVPYASTVPGVRHNCGHDLHSAIGIGVAMGYSAIRESLPGNVVLIFQPAEESGTGAEAMLDDQIFSTLRPDAILALHTFPQALGELATRPGALLAGRAQVSVTLRGSGDLNDAATRVRAALMRVSTISPAAQFLPAEPGFVFVQLGPQPARLAADNVRVEGYVMSTGIEQRAAVKEKILGAIEQVSLPDVEIDIAYRQALEGVNNDPVVLATASDAIAALLPEISVEKTPGVIPVFSEDFGSFQRELPGVMYFLGVNNTERGTVGFPHSPNFIADDAAIQIGVKAMLAASLGLMESLPARSD